MIVVSKVGIAKLKLKRKISLYSDTIHFIKKCKNQIILNGYATILN